MILRFNTPGHTNLTFRMAHLAPQVNGRLLDSHPVNGRTCYAIEVPECQDPIELMTIMRNHSMPLDKVRLTFPTPSSPTYLAYWPHVEGRQRQLAHSHG